MLSEKENIILQYLIGELDKKLSEEVEFEIFQSNTAYEDFLTTQDKLIDAYLLDKHNLSDKELKNLEKLSLISDYFKEHLDFSIMLTEVLEEEYSAKESSEFQIVRSKNLFTSLLYEFKKLFRMRLIIIEDKN